jgi:DNA-binding response OmpR family regulator
MQTILVVEDEPAIARLIRDYLERAGFAVRTATDAPTALTLARATPPDLVVLDLGLPDGDGLDVLRALRSRSATSSFLPPPPSLVPVIVVTARGEETDRVVGLELGADDYVVKPFSPRELVARVRSVLRRGATDAAPTETIRTGGLEIDTGRMRVAVDGEPVELTATEFELLTTLARQPGRVFTRGQLLAAIHGVAIESYERAIDAHVKNIRRKIEPANGAPRFVQTVYGVGYRMAEA